MIVYIIVVLIIVIFACIITAIININIIINVTFIIVVNRSGSETDDYFPAVLVGNKSDLSGQRAVSLEEVMDWCSNKRPQKAITYLGKHLASKSCFSLLYLFLSLVQRFYFFFVSQPVRTLVVPCYPTFFPPSSYKYLSTTSSSFLTFPSLHSPSSSSLSFVPVRVLIQAGYRC